MNDAQNIDNLLRIRSTYQRKLIRYRRDPTSDQFLSDTAAEIDAIDQRIHRIVPLSFLNQLQQLKSAL